MQNFGNQNLGNQKSTFGMDANLVSLLCYIANFCCYLGLVLSIITVIQDKTNKLARFHAFQSILLSGLGLAAGIGINILNGVAIAANSSALSGLVLIISLGLSLAILAALIFAAVKGFQGQIFKLPIIGEFADKWSN